MILDNDLSFTQEVHSGRREPTLGDCPLTPTCSVLYTFSYTPSLPPSLKGSRDDLVSVLVNWAA